MTRISTRGPSSGGSGGGSGGLVTPAFYGLKGWTVDPMQATSTAAISQSTLYATACAVEPGTTTLTNLHTYVHTAAAGLTYARQAVFALDGTFLGETGDIIASLQGTGFQTNPLSAPVDLPAGTEYVYAAILAVGTTGPTLPRSPATSVAEILNAGLSSQYRSGTIGGLSALPADLSALNDSNLTFFQAVS